MSETAVIKKVYHAIASVTADLSEVGIAKRRENTQQHYKFRGIDDVYNALAPVLAEHKLLILPEVLDRTQEIKPTKEGGSMFHVVLKVKYTLVSAEDGSSHEVVCFGESLDSSDKATNKAFTAAWKYLCFQMFCIPTEQSLDADNDSPEIGTPRQQPQQGRQQQQRPQGQPAAGSTAGSTRTKQKDPQFGVRMTDEELEEFNPVLAPDAKPTDEQLKDSGKRLYYLWENKRLGDTDAREIARSIASKRAALVANAGHKGFETMLVMFETAKLITNSEFRVFKSNCRSRLNLPLE